MKTMDLKVALIGLVLQKKITTHTTLTRVEEPQINFYLTNYLNQQYIINMKFKI